MNKFIPAVLLVTLAASIWKVYDVRARLGREDYDVDQKESLQSRLSSLPRQVDDGRYTGEPYAVDAKIIRNSGADVYGSVEYFDHENRSYRVYMGGAIGNQENFHAPTYCLPAAGWEVNSEDVVPVVGIAAERDGETMRRLVLQDGPRKMLVYFWFQAGSRVANHEWTVRWYRFLDLLADQPFRPTLIVTLYVPVDDTVAKTDARAMEFLRAVGPHLDHAMAPEKPIE